MCRIYSLWFSDYCLLLSGWDSFLRKLRFSGQSVTSSWPTRISANPLETKYSQVWKFQRRITRNLLAFGWCVSLLTFCLRSVFYFWKERRFFIHYSFWTHMYFYLKTNSAQKIATGNLEDTNWGKIRVNFHTGSPLCCWGWGGRCGEGKV